MACKAALRPVEELVDGCGWRVVAAGVERLQGRLAYCPGRCLSKERQLAGKSAAVAGNMAFSSIACSIAWVILDTKPSLSREKATPCMT